MKIYCCIDVFRVPKHVVAVAPVVSTSVFLNMTMAHSRRVCDDGDIEHAVRRNSIYEVDRKDSWMEKEYACVVPHGSGSIGFLLRRSVATH
jgi:hypothetical protein